MGWSAVTGDGVGVADGGGVGGGVGVGGGRPMAGWVQPGAAGGRPRAAGGGRRLPQVKMMPQCDFSWDCQIFG